MAWNAGAIVGTASLNTKKWTAGASSMGSVMKGAMGIATAAIGLCASAFIKATKDSQEFLKAFSNVDTIVDETSVDMQKLAKDILLLDPALGSATEMTNGLYMSFSAGARTAEEAMDLTVQSAKFAKAGLTDLGTAVDAISTAMNAYGAETVDAQLASDLFFQTIQYGKVTGAELASSIGQSIPAFASMGIELKQLTAGIAAMTKQGLSASESTTQLNALTNAFIKPSSAMTAALQEQGIASGSALLEAEGLTGALDFLEKATGGNKEAVAELVPNIRGMKAVFALSGEGAKIYAETLDAMSDSMGATEKAFQEQEKTIETAKNAFSNLSITAGNLGNVFVNKLAIGAQDAATGMQKFLFSAQGMESVANFAYAFTGALHTLKAILEPLVTGVMATYKEILGDLFEDITNLTAGTDGANLAFKFIGGAVKVVTTYLSVFAKFINLARDYMLDLIPMYIEGGKAVGLFLAGDYAGASKAAKQFVTNTKKTITDLKDNAGDIGATVKEAFESFGDDAGKVTQDIEDSWKVSAEASKNYVLTNYGEMLTGQSEFAEDLAAQKKAQEKKAKEDAEDAADDLKEAGENSAGGFADAWTKAFDEVGKVVKKGKDITVQDITSLGSAALAATNSVVNSISSLFADAEKQRLDNTISFWDEKIALEESYFDKRTSALEQEQTDLSLGIFNNELQSLEDLHARKLVSEEEFLLASFDLKQGYNQQTIETEAELNAVLENDKLSYEEKQKFIDAYYAGRAKKTAGEKEAAILQLEAQAADEKNKVAKKAFEAEKAQKIGQVWMDALSAELGYVSWGAPLGPPGWVAAAIAGSATLAMAGVQTGLIASQQYTPSYAFGTDFHPGGLAVVGDKPSGQGGELVNLPTGTSVTPTVQTAELLSAMDGLASINKNNTGMTNNFDFSGADFGNSSEQDIRGIVEDTLNTALRGVM